MKFPWHPDKISSDNPAKLRNFLNGGWVDAKKAQDIINPLNGEKIILMPDTREDELEPFIRSLLACPKYGLHNPLYNTERYRMYGDICRDAARFLRGNGGREYFTKLINLVMPKGLKQCAGEVDVTASFLETFSGNGVRNLAKGATTPGNHAGEQPINYRWPYGPVAIITPFNFPLEIMALQLMGALFMGNKPILKQSSITSIVAEAFVRLLLQCGMPKDDMLLIHCSGSVMEKVVTWGMPKPVVQLTQFTGSSDVAHRLLQLTGGRCKVEDSGFDWKLIGPLPQLERDKYQLLSGQIAKICDRDAYAASGQKCSAQSILFIHIADYDYFASKLNDLAAKRNLQDLSIGPVLTWNNQQIQEHINKLLLIDGAKLFFGGKPLMGAHRIPFCYGSYEPTAVYVPLDQILPNLELVTKEIFGPVQIITRWKNEEDIDLILKIFEKLENHLTAGVVSTDPEFLNHVLGRTINGTTYAGIRARTTGAPEWHFFGPAGHPASGGIGTPEAIINTWSQNRTIIYDTKNFKEEVI